jgi:hypothetical protein
MSLRAAAGFDTPFGLLNQRRPKQSHDTGGLLRRRGAVRAVRSSQ